MPPLKTESFNRECSQWFKVRGAGRGTVLLVHGLNQRPSSWADLIVYLNSLGLHVYRLALKGHRGLDFEDMREVSGRIWEEELATACEEISRCFAGLPFYLVAFSMGSLVATAVQLKTGRQLFDRQVLLAPALAVRPYTRLAIPLCTMFRQLSSRSPQEYVANREGTTAAAYRALFQLESEVNSFRDMSVLNIPTWVLMRPDDELVNYRGIRRFVERNRLNSWCLIPLEKTSGFMQFSRKFRHLIVDRRSAGPEVWCRITEAMGSFLGADSR